MADLAAFLTERLNAEQQLAEDAAVRAAAWDIAEQSPTAWGDEAPPAQILAGGKPIITFGAEYGAPLTVDHVAYWDPARVLAEIAAKRERLRLYLEAKEALTEFLKNGPPEETPATRHSYSRERIKQQQLSGRFIAYETSVRLDAMVYADREDFDPGWRA